ILLRARPVVSNDVPGSIEALGPFADEWSAPLDRDDLLAERIVRLARSVELRQSVGNAMRERVINEFGVDRMVAETVRTIVDASR
ncbi:MAG: hypothetical protein H7X80_04480, partial [bacterium]|nr:hypothetical protein [Candidatus Kapabacteria bacterium]